MSSETPELELRRVTKRYPGVVANDDVSLSVRSGEIHAIVGENGAGKSTLMSILYGLVSPDEGEILVRGDLVEFRSTLDAIDAGLGMVHQEFKLFPTMTVAENVVYGHEPRSGWLIDRNLANNHVAELAEGYGLGVDPLATNDIADQNELIVNELHSLFISHLMQYQASEEFLSFWQKSPDNQVAGGSWAIDYPEDNS